LSGKSLVIAEAIWTVAPFSQPGGWNGQAAYVLMSTETNLCDRAGANTVLPGEQMVGLTMVDIAGKSTAAPSAPGDYIVPVESYWAQKTAWLGANLYDTHCTHIGNGDVNSGTISIASIDATTITGSFDVYNSLAGGGDLTGTFAPQYCPGLENALNGTIPTCQPL
jgi:hypothetical protein